VGIHSDSRRNTALGYASTHDHTCAKVVGRSVGSFGALNVGDGSINIDDSIVSVVCGDSLLLL
jgi:hypothetical protein